MSDDPESWLINRPVFTLLEVHQILSTASGYLEFQADVPNRELFSFQDILNEVSEAMKDQFMSW